MRALDTNVLVRLLVNDDRRQGARAKRLLTSAEQRGEPLLVIDLVVLELVWVLRSAYEFSRHEVLDALELLAGMPALCFEDYERIVALIAQGRATGVDLDDLLIGLHAADRDCDATVTFDKKLATTGLFETL